MIIYILPINVIVILNRTPMNLKQMEVFIAVAESGSFSRGAEAAFITQSTVSQHISALEREFEIRLLDRTGKGALLTEGGKLFLEHARRILAEVRGAEAAMQRFRGVEGAELNVGGSNIPGDYMITPAIILLLKRFNSLTVTILQGDSHDILARLGREEVELGVVGGCFPDDRFHFSPLGEDEIRLFVSRAHPWAPRASVSLEELAEEPFIMREPGSGTGKAVTEALMKAGIDPLALKTRACLGSNEAVKQAVISGMGVSFVSGISVRDEVERGELAQVEVDGLQISRRFYLASRAGRELSPAARAFADVMQQIYKV